jgi:hypothetical protein
MKKLLLLSTAIITISVLYIHFSAKIYAQQQARAICWWLNKDKGSAPAVGPAASEALLALKARERGACRCQLVAPNRDFGAERVATVNISVQGVERIRLNYALSFGGRSFMRPIYFHYQSDH